MNPPPLPPRYDLRLPAERTDADVGIFETRDAEMNNEDPGPTRERRHCCTWLLRCEVGLWLGGGRGHLCGTSCLFSLCGVRTTQSQLFLTDQLNQGFAHAVADSHACALPPCRNWMQREVIFPSCDSQENVCEPLV